jgi:methionine sulfoxide reductase heme-binding subunit
MIMATAAGSAGLWFLSRGSGLVLLALFSAVVVLGVATRTGSAPGRWPRFAVAELHRNLSLFAVALLVLHVVTAILDPFVTIGWAATVLPFVSHLVLAGAVLAARLIGARQAIAVSTARCGRSSTKRSRSAAASGMTRFRCAC